MKKSNILGESVIYHVVGYYPPHLGGMETVAQTLAYIQHSQGLNVEIITSNIGAKSRKKYNDDSPKVSRLKSLHLAHTPIIFGLLPKLLRTKQPIVHLHVAQAYVPEMVYLASLIRKMPYVAHVHIDVGPSGKAGILLKIYKPLILKRVLQRADRVVVFTDEQKLEIQARYELQASKVVVVPNGVSDKYFYTAKRELQSKPSLLFLGRLDGQKNPAQFLKSLSDISDKFKTNIVGSGELESKMKKLASDLGLKNVKFHGRVDADRALDFYKKSDIFVMSSLVEGMPLALLEAMAMGLPTVATNVSGINSLIVQNNNGILVRLHDPIEMRDTLLSFERNSKKYQDMSNHAQITAKKYKWQNISQEFIKIYEAIHA